MGLLTYFSPGSSSVNYGDQIEEASLRFLEELIDQVCYFLLSFLLSLHTSDKLLGCRQHLRNLSLLVKSAVGVVTGLAAFLVVVSSCPAHMALYILGLSPGWELMSLFSKFSRMKYGCR